MKVTIIETGQVPEAIRERFENYPTMFARLLHQSAPDIAFETVSIVKGEPLPALDGIEALLITGSPAGVYEKDPWIGALRVFLQKAASAHIPMIGVCYGHQAIADALGADVRKSHKGFAIGRHTYDVRFCPDWVVRKDRTDTLRVAASHQDQVESLPDGAEVIAASEFTPYAALYYPDVPAFTFQCHPEFDDEYSMALYESRKGRPLTDLQVEEARASLEGDNDHSRLGRWMVQFLKATT